MADPAYRWSLQMKSFARELKGQPPVLTESLVARLRQAVRAIDPKQKPQVLEKKCPPCEGFVAGHLEKLPRFLASVGIVAAYFVSFLVLMPTLAYLARHWL